MERYFTVCHPMSRRTHPYLTSLSFYIGLATIFVGLKDLGWCVTTVTNVLVITTWDSEVLVTSLLMLFSSAMSFAAVTTIFILNILAIFKLRTKDPVIEASRVTSPNTEVERKLIFIGIVTSFFAIGSELCSWVCFFLFREFFDLPTSLLLSWCIFITNNVFNYLSYMAILSTTRSQNNDTGSAREMLQIQNCRPPPTAQAKEGPNCLGKGGVETRTTHHPSLKKHFSDSDIITTITRSEHRRSMPTI